MPAAGPLSRTPISASAVESELDKLLAELNHHEKEAAAYSDVLATVRAQYLDRWKAANTIQRFGLKLQGLAKRRKLREAGQMPAPPQSLHLCFCRLCG